MLNVKRSVLIKDAKKLTYMQLAIKYKTSIQTMRTTLKDYNVKKKNLSGRPKSLNVIV